MQQLEFFRDTDIVTLKAELKELKASNDRMRKALFARHGDLAKNYHDVLERLTILERNICNGTYQIIENFGT